MYEIKYRFEENNTEGWIKSRIKYNCKIIGRIGFRGYTKEDIVNENEGAISLSPSNINQDKLTLKDSTYLSWKKYNESPEIKVYSKDLIFVKTGSSIGKVAHISETNQCLTINPQLIVLKKIENSKFLYYFIKSSGFKCELFSQIPSSTIPNISQEKIGNINYCIPTKDEQQKIANFLDIKTTQFENIIAKKEQLIKKLEEAKKSLISEVVTGKVKIVDDQLIPRDVSEMKDSAVEWLGMIPQDWITEKMKYIGNSIIGLTYGPDDVVDANGTLVLRSSNVQNGNITFDNNVFVNKKINPKLAVKEGDILICSRNGSRNLIGKNALILKEHEGATFGAFMTIFRTKYSKFIHLVLNSTLFDYQAGSYLTSTVNQLTISNLNNMVVPFPTLNEQNAICDYLSNKLSVFSKSVDLNMNQIEKLNKAKQSLISEAVTGKIDLRDWEII